MFHEIPVLSHAYKESKNTNMFHLKVPCLFCNTSVQKIVVVWTAVILTV
jgi:hypothetical protein